MTETEMLELMKQRHSVRRYSKRKIEDKKRKILDELIADINREARLHFQIFYDEPYCFQGLKAKYGKFSGVTNYIALVGKKRPDLDEICGYYGEMLVMKAQEIGLNTCWVGVTHGRTMSRILESEKEVCIIAIGYGEEKGLEHKRKSFYDVCRILNENSDEMQDQKNLSEIAPEWFIKGVTAALLAPTAMNQQKFKILYDGRSAKLKAGLGMYTKLDLGIVEYHFETMADLAAEGN